MNTEDRPATRDTDSPYPREGLELVVPEEETRIECPADCIMRRPPRRWSYDHMPALFEHEHRHYEPRPRRLPGWLARLVR